MPYIEDRDKIVYEQGLNEITDAFARVGAGDGDLNYVLTKVAIAWLLYHQPPYNYSLRSAVMKAFTCAGFEWYERVMRPYEDKKREENGEVYPEELRGVYL